MPAPQMTFRSWLARLRQFVSARSQWFRGCQRRPRKDRPALRLTPARPEMILLEKRESFGAVACTTVLAMAGGGLVAALIREARANDSP